MTEAPSTRKGGLLYGEENAFYVYIESLVVVGFGDGAEGREFARPALAKRMSMRPFCCLRWRTGDRVGEICDITLNGGGVFAVNFPAASVPIGGAGDEDVGAFGGEALGGGEAYAAVAAGDYGYFSLVLGHCVFSLDAFGL